MSKRLLKLGYMFIILITMLFIGCEKKLIDPTKEIISPDNGYVASFYSLESN